MVTILLFGNMPMLGLGASVAIYSGIGSIELIFVGVTNHHVWIMDLDYDLSYGFFRGDKIIFYFEFFFFEELF